MLILLSNDDGIQSEALPPLVKSLEPLGEVYVVVPDRERSATSRSVTLHRPLRAEQVSEKWYAVDGMPTDCVILGVNSLLPRTPDLVVSGINKGPNLGDDIGYSGTVSAAWEGTLTGVPSFAISIAASKNFHFDIAVRFASILAKEILCRGMPQGVLFNVNVPNIETMDLPPVRWTKQGRRFYKDVVVEKTDPRKKKYYWIGGEEIEWVPDTESDYHAVEQDCISITPLSIDMTAHQSLESFSSWKFENGDVLLSHAFGRRKC